ncbi:hypothetical protein, partial [Bacillus nitratireducens]|uniref:hypothetical protein n=1 Tax=Bacillus nitratireducens TaxID=2026193 RepID=UPI001C54D2CA
VPSLYKIIHLNNIFAPMTRLCKRTKREKPKIVYLISGLTFNFKINIDTHIMINAVKKYAM